MNKRVIRAIVLSFVLIVLLSTLTGCQKSSKAIDLYVQDYRFAFSLKEVITSEEGNTVVRIQMSPEKNKKGEIAGLMDALQVVKLFPMDTYIIVNGAPVDHTEDVTADVKAVTNEEMVYIFNFTFLTDQKPEQLYIFPSGKRDDSTFHWQVDPINGKILKAAEITEE